MVIIENAILRLNLPKSAHNRPQMTCSSLEFLVAKWLEHPTSVWKVMGSFLLVDNLGV